MKFLEKLNSTDIELTALTIWMARKTFALNRVEFYEALGGMIRDGTPSLRALEFLCEIETDFGEKKGTSGMYFLAKECIASIKASGMLSGAL
ncbi:TPA: type II secretion protein F, partial [Escherichia coli]|nr:type II secretion protein F [Escherichia coli]